MSRLSPHHSRDRNNKDFSKVFSNDKLGGGSKVKFRFLRTYLNYKPYKEPEQFDSCKVLFLQPGKDTWTTLETSKPYQIANWTLEPQAQIMFQQLHLNAFNDAISNIESLTTHNTRLRAGVKLSRQNAVLKVSDFFTQIDLLQDHQSNKSINISHENINAKLDNQPWLGLTIGGTYHAGQSQLKAQIGYEKSISGNGKNGFNIQLALNHSF